MVIVALVLGWVLVAGALALLVGRSLAVADARDTWRHGRRQMRDLRGPSPVSIMPPAQERSAA